MLSIDELIKKTGNRYYLTTLVAKRSKQLNQGAKPLIENQQPAKPLFIALKEVAEDKIKWSKETA
ncbi:MAG TPA: DNA-directed RNA polymerase subunit omega [Atribacter sp.]|jgi:DNA-directed RNA polymerase subunit omega|uniref:DNA-directed RNA polymerase subunit omega n=1 Tax=Candidatus Atribacter allofermentans TaxID=1852833 RepID=A0A1V5SYZ0_9BACT|nr:DNA-directed RNA polymerase subunit omega [Atribacter sp.]MDD3713536.1 DNA-directed RNA polymerase subunit omega [Atribacterota bacterium]OQA59736.1 MAG: DNA-directed RNA polymerase subunit omega [Candidatus Atribacteria bacterium ADurb.Bin276]HHT09819.1 DNA-directed RNA polymerase subunit omega [Candidatus Atribacteria bacterium]MDI9594640.1 DNA-directed RNA polymerase subunit omega [Atribacterota bacterium]HOT04631.1 DNA-directed RNA polymerase subunit omega [Atribacter sp.]